MPPETGKRTPMRCTARHKRDKKPCRAWAVKGFTVCRMHGANAKNPGGRPLVTGLYSKNPGERLREAITAAQGLGGLEAELVLLRSRLALFLQTVEGNTDVPLGFEALDMLSRIIGRIESLVKTIQQLGVIAQLGAPDHVTVVLDGMGTVIREYVPQNRWTEALNKLTDLVRAARDSGEAEAERSPHA